MPELEAGRSYDVRVKGAIRNGQIFGDYGASCTITIIESSGLARWDANNPAPDYRNVELELYPNPSDGHEVNLSFANLPRTEEQIIIRLYDLVGRQVNSQEFKSSGTSAIISLNIEEIPNGIYSVSAELNGIQFTEKLVVK